MSISIAFEIILWLMILVGVILGIRAGFVRMAAKPLKLVLAIVVAFAFCSLVAESVVIPMINEPITNYIYGFLAENCPELSINNVAEEIPTVLKFAANLYGINLEEIVAQNAGRDIIAEITSVIATPVVRILAIAASFLVLYIASKIVVALAFALIDLLFSYGIFGSLNKILGALCGGVVAFGVAWAVAVLVKTVFHVDVDGILYEFFNTYSPIELLLSF